MIQEPRTLLPMEKKTGRLLWRADLVRLLGWAVEQVERGKSMVMPL